MLKFSRQEHGNEDLEDAPLHSHDRNQTQDGMRRIPQFQKPQEFEKRNHAHNRTEVRNGSHRRTELVGTRVETWTKENGDEEEGNEQRHVEYNRSEGDDGDSQQSRLNLAIDRKRLYKQVTNDKDGGETEWSDDLAHHNRLPRCSRDITRQLSSAQSKSLTHLFRRQAQSLSLETGNLRSGQSTIPDPRIRMCSRITPRHPSQEFSIIDDKVGKRELMRVEEEWRDT